MTGLWFMFLLVEVLCAMETDVLVKIWKGYEDKRALLAQELEIIDTEIRVEKNSVENLNKLTSRMEKLRDSLVDSDPYVDSPESYAAFEEFKQHVNLDYRTSRSELLEAENKMELMWTDLNFWYSYDYIIDKGLLTPKPEIPVIDPRSLARLKDCRIQVLRAENNKILHMLKRMKKVFEDIGEDKGILKDMGDFFGPVHERIDLTKFRVEEQISDHKKASDLKALIEEFQRNQETKVELINQIETMRTARRVNDKFSEDLGKSDGNWATRLGMYTSNSNEISDTQSIAMEDDQEFLPKHIASLSYNGTRRVVPGDDAAKMP